LIRSRHHCKQEITGDKERIFVLLLECAKKTSKVQKCAKIDEIKVPVELPRAAKMLNRNIKHKEDKWVFNKTQTIFLFNLKQAYDGKRGYS
jgi:hypothetical protein